MPIRPLPPTLISQIAAGEVIERPASVVKELLENSLDAGATRIDVALEDGGTTLIAVSDDGAGIAPEELPLAVAPHATSKIATVEDLFNIGTMGFRGEALASIAAVSRVRVTSRPRGQNEAACIDAADGAVSPVRPAAAAPGTTVEVRHLFYNVPARRKFLRTPSAELSHVTEQIARIALVRPDVALTQTHAGRTLRRLPATGDRRARIADFYGLELADALIPFRRSEPDLQIEGLFAPPAASRANARWQYVFLNGRYIRDRDLSGFVFREAFRGLIEPARFPVVFLFLTAHPSSFDINVHPQKIEVRWRDAGRVKSQVLAALRETILSRDLTPTLRTGPGLFDPAAARANVSALVEQLRAAGAERVAEAARRAMMEEDAAGMAATAGPATAGAGAGAGMAAPRPFALHSPPPPTLWQGRGGPTGAFSGRAATAMELYAPPRTPVGPAGAPAAGPPDAPAADLPTRPAVSAVDRLSQLDAGESATAVGARGPREGAASCVSGGGVYEANGGRAIQIHNTYLVCETPEGLLIVDQHALHERVMYESLMSRITAGPLESQRLLLPETLEVSPEQMAAVDGAADLLRRLGLEAEPFGPRSIIVRAAPSMLSDAAVREFLIDLLDRLCDAQPSSPDALLHDMIAMMACKAAVKAGDRLSPELIDALLAQRHLVEKASNCPHGRPTTLRLTVADLERQFKRT